MLRLLKVLSSVWTWIQIIFRKKSVKEFVQEFVNPAISLVEAVKATIDNPKVDWLTSLTESDWDDNLIDRAEDILAKAIARLYDVKKWSEKNKELSNQEIIEKFFEKMRAEDKNVQSALLAKIASNIAYNQSRFTKKAPKEFESDTLVAMTYAAKKCGLTV
jgi:uncharacterized protein YaaR (DUF327 family)